MFKKFLAILVMLYATLAFAAVDANKATSAELDSVKGIGPVTSALIMSERKKGPFKNWQDFIDRVKGVGESRAAKLSAEGLTVNGSAYKGAVAGAKDEKKDAKAAAKEEKKDAKDAKKDAKADAKADAMKPAASGVKPAASDAKAAASAMKPAASAKK